MKAIVTGTNGTVAPVLASTLQQNGHSVTAWDRSLVPTDSRDAMVNFIDAEQPDWFFHIATGDPAWAESVAQICAERGTKFLFTSSVSVFSGQQQGPLTPNTVPTPDDDYGRYKFECEQRVRSVNADSLIVRLGWQIGSAAGGNHMLDHLIRTHQENGQIDASVNWYQACSFLEDTADGLLYVMERFSAELYHLDSNRGLTFYDIVIGLNQLHGNAWQVNAVDAPVHNNLMPDLRLPIPTLSERLQRA